MTTGTTRGVIPISSDSPIHVVIVDYRTPHFATESAGALASIYPTTVVNTGPEQAFYGENVDTIHLPQNPGYGAAINTAVAEFAADYALVMNADVRIHPTAVDTLRSALAASGLLIAGPSLFWDDRMEWRLPPALDFTAEEQRFLAHRWDDSEQWAAAEKACLARHNRLWSATQPVTVSTLSGACMLLNVRPLREHLSTLFDPQFRLYFEETDLCRRSESAGFPPLYVPGAAAIHYWDASPNPESASKAEEMHRSGLHYARKHGLPSVPEIYRNHAICPTTFRTLPNAIDPPPAAKWIDISLDCGFSQFASGPVESLRTLPDRIKERESTLFIRLRDRRDDVLAYYVRPWP